MSASMVQMNIMTEMQAIATAQLAMKNRLQALVAMWSAEGMSALTDADIQELAEFEHVTAQELTAAKNAMDTIASAVGEYAAGTAATKLLRIVLCVPH